MGRIERRHAAGRDEPEQPLELRAGRPQPVEQRAQQLALELAHFGDDRVRARQVDDGLRVAFEVHADGLQERLRNAIANRQPEPQRVDVERGRVQQLGRVADTGAGGRHRDLDVGRRGHGVRGRVDRQQVDLGLGTQPDGAGDVEMKPDAQRGRDRQMPGRTGRRREAESRRDRSGAEWNLDAAAPRGRAEQVGDRAQPGVPRGGRAHDVDEPAAQGADPVFEQLGHRERRNPRGGAEPQQAQRGLHLIGRRAGERVGGLAHQPEDEREQRLLDVGARTADGQILATRGSW